MLSASKGRDTERLFRWGVLSVYILIASANIITHEMWRDELQVWFTNVESKNLQELMANLEYQGHPPLWYLMLYVLSRVTRNPAAMQALHLVIAVGGAYIFLRFAPFSRLWRLLFVFGYFPLYEYAAISRNYGIGMLLLFCFCAACGAKRKNFFILSLILFLYSLVNVYAFIITICLLAALAFKVITDAEARAALIKRKLTILPCAALVATGLVISGVVMHPSPDCMFSEKLLLTFYPEWAAQTGAAVWQGLVPIPQLTQSFWNTNIIPSMPLQNILSVALVCFLLFSTTKNRTIFLFFFLSIVSMVIFQYVFYLGYLRHFGHFYLILIVCLWLEKIWGQDKSNKTGLLTKSLHIFERGRQPLVVILLIANFAAGIFASVMEWRYPFTQGKNAANYIREKELDKLPIIGYPDFTSATVAGYLDKKIYFANSDTFGRFVIFDKKRKIYLTVDEVIEKTRQFAEKNHSDVLLIVWHEIGGAERVITELKGFTGNLEGDENFYLYLMKYKEQ